MHMSFSYGHNMHNTRILTCRTVEEIIGRKLAVIHYVTFTTLLSKVTGKIFTVNNIRFFTGIKTFSTNSYHTFL